MRVQLSFFAVFKGEKLSINRSTDGLGKEVPKTKEDLEKVVEQPTISLQLSNTGDLQVVCSYNFGNKIVKRTNSLNDIYDRVLKDKKNKEDADAKLISEYRQKGLLLNVDDTVYYNDGTDSLTLLQDGSLLLTGSNGDTETFKPLSVDGSLINNVNGLIVVIDEKNDSFRFFYTVKNGKAIEVNIKNQESFSKLPDDYTLKITGGEVKLNVGDTLRYTDNKKDGIPQKSLDYQEMLNKSGSSINSHLINGDERYTYEDQAKTYFKKRT